MHCNLCFERQAKAWHISSCGKIACQNCVQKLKKTQCDDCKGPCTRTLELNSKAPKEVRRLFGDITEEIKAVSKIMNFQETQKAKFIQALKRNNAKLDKKRADMVKLKESKLVRIEEAKIRLAAVNEDIKRKKTLIKSYDANTENQPPLPSDSLLSLFPQPDTGAPGFLTSTPIPHQTQAGNHTLEADFMQLRTPAAWYNPEGIGLREEVKAHRRSFDRPRAKVKSPARTSFDRCRAEVKSPARTSIERSIEEFVSPTNSRKSFDIDMHRAEKMKSPVEKALDKLLGEYINPFFSNIKVTFLIQSTTPL